jgi:BolA protein
VKVSELIESLIEQNLQPEMMQLTNDSGKHKGHAGDDGSGQTHLSLMVVSDAFDGMSRVERQRLVNTTINPAFSQGLHAISMKLFTPSEYTAK